MSITIEAVSEVTPELVAAFNCLLPELSSSASLLTAKELMEIVTSPCATLFVAIDQSGNIFGFLTLVVFRIPTGLRAWVEDVVVSSKARGQGIGAALCKHALEHAKLSGAVSVDLTSRPSREAANLLYQKLGFTRRETNVYRFSHAQVKG
jgi:ribosomal protein S18 acetylase RimI-like enzyme